jgi:hypothetical protein
MIRLNTRYRDRDKDGERGKGSATDLGSDSTPGTRTEKVEEGQRKGGRGTVSITDLGSDSTPETGTGTEKVRGTEREVKGLPLTKDQAQHQRQGQDGERERDRAWDRIRH